MDQFSCSGKCRRVGSIDFRQNFIRNFDVTIDLNNAMFRIRNPEKKLVIKTVILIKTKESKAPVFLSRRLRLKANEATIVTLTMMNYIEFSDNK